MQLTAILALGSVFAVASTTPLPSKQIDESQKSIVAFLCIREVGNLEECTQRHERCLSLFGEPGPSEKPEKSGLAPELLEGCEDIFHLLTNSGFPGTSDGTGSAPVPGSSGFPGVPRLPGSSEFPEGPLKPGSSGFNPIVFPKGLFPFDQLQTSNTSNDPFTFVCQLVEAEIPNCVARATKCQTLSERNASNTDIMALIQESTECLEFFALLETATNITLSPVIPPFETTKTTTTTTATPPKSPVVTSTTVGPSGSSVTTTTTGTPSGSSVTTATNETPSGSLVTTATNETRSGSPVTTTTARTSSGSSVTTTTTGTPTESPFTTATAGTSSRSPVATTTVGTTSGSPLTTATTSIPSGSPVVTTTTGKPSESSVTTTSSTVTSERSGTFPDMQFVCAFVNVPNCVQRTSECREIFNYETPPSDFSALYECMDFFEELKRESVKPSSF